MTKREMVISALRAEANGACGPCPYRGRNNDGIRKCRQFALDALEILERQSNKQEPKPADVFKVGSTRAGNCPSCGGVLIWGADYCHWCGQHIKWDEEPREMTKEYLANELDRIIDVGIVNAHHDTDVLRSILNLIK